MVIRLWPVFLSRDDNILRKKELHSSLWGESPVENFGEHWPCHTNLQLVETGELKQALPYELPSLLRIHTGSHCGWSYYDDYCYICCYYKYDDAIEGLVKDPGPLDLRRNTERNSVTQHEGQPVGMQLEQIPKP